MCMCVMLCSCVLSPNSADFYVARSAFRLSTLTFCVPEVLKMKHKTWFLLARPTFRLCALCAMSQLADILYFVREYDGG